MYRAPRSSVGLHAALNHNRIRCCTGVACFSCVHRKSIISVQHMEQQGQHKKRQRKLLNSTQVQARVKASRWTIDRLEKAKKFPKHVNFVPGRKHWFEDEIDDHLECLAAEREIVAA